MKNSTVNNTNTHTQNTTTDLTVDFMTGNMVNLLKACRSLRELERLLTMLNGINEDNRVLNPSPKDGFSSAGSVSIV